MTQAGTDADRDLALSLVSSRLGWMDVLPAGHGSRLPWSCADMLDAQDRGEDPTAPWRQALAATTARQYRQDPPPAMPAAFVLLWYLDVLANPLAFAAALGPGVKMSSRQRRGAVEDTWEIASRRAAEACLPPPPPKPQRRQSCCFIFTLPGASTCAMCPRLSRPAGR